MVKINFQNIIFVECCRASYGFGYYSFCHDMDLVKAWYIFYIIREVSDYVRWGNNTIASTKLWYRKEIVFLWDWYYYLLLVSRVFLFFIFYSLTVINCLRIFRTIFPLRVGTWKNSRLFSALCLLHSRLWRGNILLREILNLIKIGVRMLNDLLS